MPATQLVEVALNGARSDDEHPAVSRTPAQLATAAAAAAAAGAHIVHLHAFDVDGRQTLAAEPCAEALRAARAACPGIPVSLTTSAEVEPDPERRLALVAAWTEPLERGHGIRTGLEDTVVLPDGRLAADNAELVRAIAGLLS